LNVPGLAGLMVGLGLLTGGLAQPQSPSPVGGVVAGLVSGDQMITPLTPGLWLHESKEVRGVPVTRDLWRSRPVYGPSANGMLAEIDGGLLLIDTPWTDEQTTTLLDFVQSDLRRRIVAAVVTHSHADRMGGLGALRRAGIPVGALDLTVAKARLAGEAPDVLFTAHQGVHRDARGFELFYPGPGHTSDNIVVWLPRQRALFGGCLVKEAAATGLGNVAEADLASWPKAIAAVAERYPTAEVVVPGHGAEGTLTVLGHTLALLRAAASPAAEPH
jgi:glyoxylase-like metal-dependent hydrolase (beta-lactamase superfamily II)